MPTPTNSGNIKPPIQLLRSLVASKRPLPVDLAEGQPAVNLNINEPGLFFTDESQSQLYKIGPCHVGDTAPNATPAVGGYTGNSKGEFWLDTTDADNPILKVWDGLQWNWFGYVSSNVLWVDPAGDDGNSGLSPNSPKKTIKAALDEAISGMEIRVAPGTYSEDNPLAFPYPNISLIGSDVNTVIIEVQNASSPAIEVRSGCNISNFTITGTLDPGESLVTFSASVTSVTSPPEVSNLKNLVEGSVGVKVDAGSITGTPLIKVKSFYQNAVDGTGFHAVNKGFIEAVDCQTVFSGTSVLAESGGTINLTGCKSSCGEFGIYADGVGAEEQLGELVSVDSTRSIFALDNLTESTRPYVGQVVSLGTLYYKGLKFTVTDQGNGFTSTPEIVVSLGTGPSAIAATGEAIIEGGKLVDIVLKLPGRGYALSDTITVSIVGGGPSTPASAALELEPIYYTVLESTEIVANSCTITIAENVPYSPTLGSDAKFYRASRVFANSHMMEYVGCGSASPYSGIPAIKKNQVTAINGGKAYVTSMDETGSFFVGKDLVVDQNAGIVYGEGFSRSLLNAVVSQSLIIK